MKNAVIRVAPGLGVLKTLELWGCAQIDGGGDNEFVYAKIPCSGWDFVRWFVPHLALILERPVELVRCEDGD